MEFLELLEKRRSIRSYQKKEVSEGVLGRILKAAIKAPSAGNLQAWEFIIIREREVKEKVCNAALGQEEIKEAPVSVVICANKQRSGAKYGKRGGEFYSTADAVLASAFLMLAVANEGLGTVYIGAFDERGVSEALGLPEHIRPVGIFPIGYPAEEPGKSSRMELEEVLHRERF